MAENGSNRRQKAAAARDASQAGEKRRERTVRLVGGLTVLVVVVGIIGIAVFARSTATPTAIVTTAPDAAAAVPAGVLPAGDAHEFGVPYGTAAAGAPVLEIWEDFQCPSCRVVEEKNGAGISKLAEEGKVALIWRPTTFLDRNLQNDSSARAVAAWGCAIDAGKTREFHDTVFTNQPTTEGDGYTQAQLIGFGEQVGISGDALATFTTCVTDGTYRAWAANSNQVFYDSEIQGTPFALLNGAELPTETLLDQVKLETAVAAVTVAK